MHWMKRRTKTFPLSGWIRRELRELQSRQHFFGEPLAAAAREWESVAERRTDMLLHRVLQQAAGAMQPRLHRLGQDADQLGGLLDAHALDQAGDEHDAERLRQFVDGVFEQRAQLAL